MDGLEKVTMSIAGTSPLLMHNPSAMKGGQAALGRKKIPTPEDEAAASVYWHVKDKQLGVPTFMFRGSVLGAAKGLRLGKFAMTGVVKGAIFVEEGTFGLTDAKGKPLAKYDIDTRRVVVQNNGVLRSRARVPNWHVKVDFWVDPQALESPEEQLRALLDRAGRMVGIGDFRPEKTGPFGRFMVL